MSASGMESVESVLSRWGESLETPRADEMGRHGDILRTGHDPYKNEVFTGFRPKLYQNWPLEPVRHL